MAGVTAPAWGGTLGSETGGVVAIDASGTLILGGATLEGQSNRAIFVAGRCFRGAAGVTASANGNDAEWRSTAHASGGKGEGIVGTPRLMSSKSNAYGASVTAATLTAAATGARGYPFGTMRAARRATPVAAAPKARLRRATGSATPAVVASPIRATRWRCRPR